MAAVAATPALAHGSSKSFPDVISLPEGWRPEGVVIGRGTNFYVGSLADGAIWHGDLRTGEGGVLAAGAPGEATTGLEFDQRGRIWAAGAGTGVGKVYDSSNGARLRTYTFAPPGTAFINDVVVTKDAAYFTDTGGARLFEVPIGIGGQLSDQSAVRTIPLVGSPTPAGPNGIETTPDGTALLVIASGQLFRVDPVTGQSTLVSVTGSASDPPLVNGDGIVRRGRTLFVVQNRSNQIAVVKLDPSGSSGTVTQVLTDDDLDVPSTADLFGNAVYAVNARFGIANPATAEYQVVRVER
jgi:sugar lactone lactonase YvrE